MVSFGYELGATSLQVVEVCTDGSRNLAKLFRKSCFLCLKPLRGCIILLSTYTRMGVGSLTKWVCLRSREGESPDTMQVCNV